MGALVRSGWWCVLALGIPALAHAQQKDTSRAEQVGPTPDALPGINRVGVPRSGARGLTLAGTASYGFTEAVLDDGDSHHRLAGRLAAQVRLVPWLSFGGSLNGRFDSHSSDSGDDSGLVGDPRLLVRANTEVHARFNVGAQLGLWLPGGSAPSIKFDATTLEGLLLASYRLGVLSVAAQAGFRWDNSAHAVDEPDQLTLNDRLALGLSDYNAVLAGLGVVGTFGELELLGEVSWEPYMGSGAPAIKTAPLRVSGGARWQPMTDVPLKVQFIAEAIVSSRPAIELGAPLVPVEPRIVAMLGLTYAFAFERASKEEAPPAPVPSAPPKAAEKPVLGSATLTVTDDAGGPMVATVRWQAHGQEQEL